MSSIPLPALAVKAPEQPDLLGQVGKMMSLKSMLGQQQIQQQTIQENDLNLKDQQAMRALAPKYVTKDSSGQVTGYDTEGFANAALSAGVSPKTVTGLREQQAKATKDFADAGAAKLKLEKDKNENSYQVLEGVRSEKDPVARGQAYQQGIAKLSQMGTDVSKFPQDHVPTDDELTQYEIPLGMHGQAITDAGKIQEAEKNKAQARMDNANAAMKEIETKGLQALTPESISKRVDSVFDPKDPTSAGQNRMLKAMTLGALQQGDLPGAQKILQDGFTKAIQAASEIQVATDPGVQSGKEKVAAVIGATKAAQEATTARGSNAALANVPPHLVAPATADATKAGTEFAQNQAVTQRLNAMMDAAKRGNVVSYQIIPEEGTLQITTSQGVHRINRTEIEQYAGGGSLWQRLEGHFGKALSGASIPDSVLKDMAEIQKIQQDGAKAKYQNTLKTINQNYGSNFQPTEMPTDGTGGGSGKPWEKYPVHQ